MGDLASQSEQAYPNVAAALNAAGASFNDVAKVMAYVVDWIPEKMEQLVSGATRAAEKLGFDPQKINKHSSESHRSALPEFLVEVEAIAVVDQRCSSFPR